MGMAGQQQPKAMVDSGERRWLRNNEKMGTNLGMVMVNGK
jgi:hypothetical protein